MNADMERALSLITPELKLQFQEDGIVYVPQLIAPEWLQAIKDGWDHIYTETDQAIHKFYDGLEGEFMETVRNHELSPEIQRMMKHSPIADVASKLLESAEIWLYQDEYFIKEGGNSRRTPWHQDLMYWPMEGEKIVSIWMSIDPLEKEECLEFVPGSHHLTQYDGFDPGDVGNSQNTPYYGGGLPQLPDIEAERDKWNIASWKITPGDALIFHSRMLHGGGQTLDGTRRRALVVRCYGDDVVFALRPDTRPESPFTPELSSRLKPGDPLRDSEYFPQLRP
jgi:ectoine hydroxylase-related dioxygenase (phytanoyl-CoA dioxygenase family)